MQPSREIERGSGSALVAYECRVETGLHGIGLRRLSQLGEADRLIAESRQNLLVPQQALAFRFKHQHGFASTTTSHTWRMLNGYPLIGRDRSAAVVIDMAGPSNSSMVDSPNHLSDDG